jgi:ElaB/YqjD/DUF883 family membrane-anchored ribosome-binding protein
MLWNEVQSGWTDLRAEARRHFSRLTDDDLASISGDRGEFRSRLQARYGYTEPEADQQIAGWLNSIGSRNQDSLLLGEIERLKAEINSLLTTAKDAAVDASKETSETTARLLKDLEASIERNPAQAILIAAGVGLVLGWLTRSRES